jgi:very-short-patch-repair endonuclease
VAGRSAALLHGFSGFVKSRPEIMMPFPGNSRSPIARVIRSRHFHAISTTTTMGYLCTTVAETILTLSLRETSGTIERCLDDQLARGILAVSDFAPIFERLVNARQRGLPMLRSLVRERSDDAYEPPTTALERLLYRSLEHPALPSYTRQVPMGYSQVSATVDAYIPNWRMIVEGDGRRWHTRKADFERDRLRDNAATAAGMVVIRFTYQMLRNHPEECLQTLLQAGRWRQSA